MFENERFSERPHSAEGAKTLDISGMKGIDNILCS